MLYTKLYPHISQHSRVYNAASTYWYQVDVVRIFQWHSLPLYKFPNFSCRNEIYQIVRVQITSMEYDSTKYKKVISEKDHLRWNK